MAVSIKICGLTRTQDASAAEAAGATYGGVILATGSPRTVPPSRVSEIFSGTKLKRCGVFVDEDPIRIAELVEELTLDVVQLHGDETPGTVEKVSSSTRGEVWKAIRPRTGGEFVSEAHRYGSLADVLLLDGWSLAARGGTGSRFPWAEVAEHRPRLNTPLRLAVAGGLKPENVAEIIVLLNPEIVDVSSGVEVSPGIKDPESISKFTAAVSGAETRGGSIDGSTVGA